MNIKLLSSTESICLRTSANAFLYRMVFKGFFVLCMQHEPFVYKDMVRQGRSGIQ